MRSSPRVLIADDSREMLTRVSDLLRARFEVVAQAADGRSALEAASRFDPDLAVLDIAMPGLNGIQTARELRRLGSRATIVFLTTYGDDDYLSAAFMSGALGFVVKSRWQVDLIPALDHALAGYRFVSPQGFRGKREPTPIAAWFQANCGFHTMQFYSDESDRLRGAIDYVIAALNANATVIYVDTKAHLAELMQQLEVCGLDLHAAVEPGYFVALDVYRDVLPRIVIGGRLDVAQMVNVFDEAFGRPLSPGQKDRRLALAGEIAPVLWVEGIPEAAIEVERVSDELVHARSASLYCTYPAQWLYKKRHHEILAKLCTLHTSLVPESPRAFPG